jgi:pimeloyl-ACP methyl ester carboxylesterase
MPDIANQNTRLECPQRDNRVSFRLVDEHGQGSPYAGLPYLLHDQVGQIYTGELDNDGHASVNGIYSGPVILELSTASQGASDPWYEELIERKAFALALTELQVAAEQSPRGPRHPDGSTYLARERAEREQAAFLRVEVSDFVEAKAHLPARDSKWKPAPNPRLKACAGRACERPGVALEPGKHHVLEVKALRAYSPLLSRDKAFCALNAYHLAVLSNLAYAPFSEPTVGAYRSAPPPYSRPGSIGHVLHEQLPRLEHARQFDKARYPLLYEEVPYSKRLEVMPYDPERYRSEAEQGWRNPEDVHFLYHKETHTQAFITHSDKLVLISLRGTEPNLMLNDIRRDLDARQVPYEGKADTGQAHRGFHDGFIAARDFAMNYLRAFHRPEQSIIVCGHSLGGAVALLLAEWLRNNFSENTQLYTFGAPRAGDRLFVQQAQALTHHRLVNHNDPIPTVPSAWMDVEWKLALPAAVLATSLPGPGIALLLAGLINLRDDPYEHHGEQWHFMPRQGSASLLWQPGCDAISAQSCAHYASDVGLEGDMPRRASFLTQVIDFEHHSIASGYSAAAIATLLRWNASLSRQGQLFTEEEATALDEYAEKLEQAMADWRPATFQQFRHSARRRFDTRLYNKTDLELHALYQQGVMLARTVSSGERMRLTELRRHLAQAQRLIAPRQVFGEFAERDDLPALVTQWRAQADVQRIERVAKVKVSASPEQVSV